MDTNIWERVLARIETKVNRHSFYTWFKPAVFLDDDGRTMRVKVPDPLVRNWLLKHYSAVLAEALEEVGRKGSVVEFQADSPESGRADSGEDPFASPEAPPPVVAAGLAGAAGSDPAPRPRWLYAWSRCR